MVRDQFDVGQFHESVAAFRAKEGELAKSIIHEMKAAEPACQVAYLANTTPEVRAKYIFITMEPSFGRWAGDEASAARMLARGYKNFLWSTEDFLFHYAIATYLDAACYITDISKIAMMVKDANRLRARVYPKWIQHLKEELAMFGTEDHRVFFVGNKVRDCLAPVLPPARVAGTIIHYSGQAAPAREAIANARPGAYARFSRDESLSRDKIVELASRLLAGSGMDALLAREILGRLEAAKAILSPSRIQLLYAYHAAFREEKNVKS